MPVVEITPNHGFADPAAAGAHRLLAHRVLRFAGEPLLRELVKRHHCRLLDSTIAWLFPRDRDQFAALVRQVADFVVSSLEPEARGCHAFPGWTRGPGRFPIMLSEDTRAVWLAHLLAAMTDVGLPEEVHGDFWAWAESASIQLVSSPAERAAPRRFPFQDARPALGPLMALRRRPVMCPA
jgi:hypothetical protein